MSAVSGLTYWSGVWATAILLMALAVTPAATISRWPALLDVRRMIGVTALAYTIAYVAIYFAFRLELCIHRQRDGDETYSDPGNAVDHRATLSARAENRYHPDRFGVIRFAKQARSARETVMRGRFLGGTRTVGVVVAAAAISVSIDPAAAQAVSVSAAASAPVPKTPWGEPDL